MTYRIRGLRCLVAVSLLLATPAFAAAQESRSSQLATELATLLDAMKLDSIAANVEGDEYAGALYFTGSQLLVVKARYSVPERMDVQLAERNYREVYIDLNSASIPDSKILVSDLGADGLRARRGQQRAVRHGGHRREELCVRWRLGQGGNVRAGVHGGLRDERRGIHADARSARRAGQAVDGVFRRCARHIEGSPSGLPFFLDGVNALKEERGGRGWESCPLADPRSQSHAC